MANVINVPNMPVPRASSTGQLSSPIGSTSQPAKNTRFAAAAPLIMQGIGTAVGIAQNAANNQRAQANAWQQRMWQLEDRAHYEEYNRPANQMARLRAAGINPLLASQSISPGESQQLNADAPANVPQVDIGSMVSSASQPLMQSAQMEQDLSLRQRELDLEGDKIENEKRRIDSEVALNKVVERLQGVLANKTDAERRQILAQVYEQTYRNMFLGKRIKQEIDSMDADVERKTLENKFSRETFATRVAAVESGKREIDERIKLMQKQGQCTEAQAQFYRAQTSRILEDLKYELPKWMADIAKHNGTKAYWDSYSAELAYRFQVWQNQKEQDAWHYYTKYNRPLETDKLEHESNDFIMWWKDVLGPIVGTAFQTTMAAYTFGASSAVGKGAQLGTKFASPTLSTTSPMPASTVNAITKNASPLIIP